MGDRPWSWQVRRLSGTLQGRAAGAAQPGWSGMNTGGPDSGARQGPLRVLTVGRPGGRAEKASWRPADGLLPAEPQPAASGQIPSAPLGRWRRAGASGHRKGRDREEAPPREAGTWGLRPKPGRCACPSSLAWCFRARKGPVARVHCWGQGRRSKECREEASAPAAGSRLRYLPEVSQLDFLPSAGGTPSVLEAPRWRSIHRLMSVLNELPRTCTDKSLRGHVFPFLW